MHNTYKINYSRITFTFLVFLTLYGILVFNSYVKRPMFTSHFRYSDRSIIPIWVPQPPLRSDGKLYYYDMYYNLVIVVDECNNKTINNYFPRITCIQANSDLNSDMKLIGIDSEDKNTYNFILNRTESLTDSYVFKMREEGYIYNIECDNSIKYYKIPNYYVKQVVSNNSDPSIIFYEYVRNNMNNHE